MRSNGSSPRWWIERVIARAHSTLVKAGIADPRIGVCGINPHAGENGLFGRGEEATKIEPAVAACRARGWNVKGPLPADTLFFLAARGDYDIVVAMYHDQGHGPIKSITAPRSTSPAKAWPTSAAWWKHCGKR
jgi:4-phospho-D-threonate 3-dehydrogenase / 4-phospho-D-erythronate 3-dehydrogenase